MKITEFAEAVTWFEGGKKSLSIAQIKEVLKITNTLTNGMLYKHIRKVDELKWKDNGMTVRWEK